MSTYDRQLDMSILKVSQRVCETVNSDISNCYLNVNTDVNVNVDIHIVVHDMTAASMSTLNTL